MADRKSYIYDPVDSGRDSEVKQKIYRMEEGKPSREYLIAGAVNIGILCTGLCMGWTSPMGSILSNEVDSPLGFPVTLDQMAWIGSLVAVGAIFGPFIAGLLTPTIGRKYTMLVAALPIIIGWVLIIATSSVPMIYVARILWGVSVGMLYTAAPMYIAEISSPAVRGALLSFLQIFVVIGFLIMYIIGPYTSYHFVAYFCIAFTVLFVLVVFFFTPDSPIFFLSKGKRDEAIKSLMWIRGKSEAGVLQELDTMQSEYEESTREKAKLSDIWTSVGNRKAMFISCGLVGFQQLAGINVVLFYMDTIFAAAKTPLDSSVATIIIGAVQVLASCVTPFVVDRLGRRLLLLISSLGMAIGLALLGMFFILSVNESPIAETLSFLPVLSMVLYIIVYCVGFGPLPWAVMGELFPINIKAVAAPIATAFCWVLAFLLTRFFSQIADALGMHYAFWIFGIFCVIAFIFTLLLVPETKGKSLQEIQDVLNNRRSSVSKDRA